MSAQYGDAQRIVLCGTRWEEARHLVLDFGASPSPLSFLNELRAHCWPARAGGDQPQVQASLGFSRRGLQHAQVPQHVLALFALKSPAFYAGAALRAQRYLGVSGRNGPEAWEPQFSFTALDAVLSLHGMDGSALDRLVTSIRTLARDTALTAKDAVRVMELPPARRLVPPPNETTDAQASWVHFGYRDGLSQVGIECWTAPELAAATPVFQHAAGEFLLGHPQGCGANPWIAGPGIRVWPEQLRSFFHNGSFGVLNQIEQDALAFEQFVQANAHLVGGPRELKGKLCGRYTDGSSLGAKQNAPEDEFTYADDKEGYGCPFGAHARRMNPRGGPLSNAMRPRPLLRRGTSYGKPIWGQDSQPGEQRGLIAHFFCASIEDQFEHLVGQWADRVPLGGADRGGARDPLVGAHQPGDGAFEIPQGAGKPPLRLEGLRPFTRTAGVAYLFYPSLPVLEKMLGGCLWRVIDKDDE